MSRARAPHPAPAWGRAAAVGLGVFGLLVPLACRSAEPPTAQIDPNTFQAQLVEREKITPEQARCVSDQVFTTYDNASIRQISEQGITSLPSPKWAPYTYGMIECVMGDELLATEPTATTPGTRP